MALFVQIDHFRKTDQKPTVKNHLFSISWFRSFNRTSFQQQLKLECAGVFLGVFHASIVHPFNNNWNLLEPAEKIKANGFNRTSFQQQLKPIGSMSLITIGGGFNRTSFQQQLKRRTSRPGRSKRPTWRGWIHQRRWDYAQINGRVCKAHAW